MYPFTECEPLHLVSKFANTTCFDPLIKGSFVQILFPILSYFLFEMIKPLTFGNKVTFKEACWRPGKWQVLHSTPNILPFIPSLCDEFEGGTHSFELRRQLLVHKRILINQLEPVTSGKVWQAPSPIHRSTQDLSPVAPQSDESQLTENYFLVY